MSNSEITWRQAPQGAQGPSVSATTARALKFVRPSDTALNIAVRSAQLVKP
jgi:hypothetical protein